MFATHLIVKIEHLSIFYLVAEEIESKADKTSSFNIDFKSHTIYNRNHLVQVNFTHLRCQL